MKVELRQYIQQSVARALAEDIGQGDVTAQLIPDDADSRATIVSREDATIAGIEWVNEVFAQLDDRVEVAWQVQDGDVVGVNQLLCQLAGPSRSLLTGERTALNFLQTLSGTATLARQYAQAVEGLDVKVLDTRKTIPGLRLAQKYAVTCGGCFNHRVGLYDGILIKENHIMAAGSIGAAVSQAKKLGQFAVEVEVENLDEVKQALDAKADILLLDNFTLEQLTEAVKLNARQAKLEASGGVSLDRIRQIAETGVDFISVGGLTKDVKALDLSMRFF